jgi:hypothetical protein
MSGIGAGAATTAPIAKVGNPPMVLKKALEATS